MKRCIAFLLVLTIAPSICVGDMNDMMMDSAGRYTITTSQDGLYFLDTQTGALWLKSDRGTWNRVDSPVSPADPIQVKKKPPKRVTLALPKDGVAIPMIQRRRRAVPGSKDTLFVCLGDITGAQVTVSVIDVTGKTLLERTSLKNLGVAKFNVNKQEVYVQVIDMVNNLLGEDICTVRMTNKKPVVETAEDPTKAKETAF